MGLGYAMWDNAQNVDFTISTGSIDPKFNTDEYEVEGNSGISLFFKDERVLQISGDYYPSSDVKISLDIKNEGNVPITTDGYTTNDDTGISELVKHSNKGIVLNIQSDKEPISDNSYEFEEYGDDIQDSHIESFDDGIQDYKDSSYQANILSCQAEIRGLESSIQRYQHTILKLEALIDEAKNIAEQHTFDYSIHYIQEN